VESVTGPISKIISKDGLDGLYRRLDKDGRVVFAMGKIDQADMWQVGQNGSRTRSLWIRSPPVSLRRDDGPGGRPARERTPYSEIANASVIEAVDSL
jgi:ketol-acid reductoisomerase